MGRGHSSSRQAGPSLPARTLTTSHCAHRPRSSTCCAAGWRTPTGSPSRSTCRGEGGGGQGLTQRACATATTTPQPDPERERPRSASNVLDATASVNTPLQLPPPRQHLRLPVGGGGRHEDAGLQRQPAVGHQLRGAGKGPRPRHQLVCTGPASRLAQPAWCHPSDPTEPPLKLPPPPPSPPPSAAPVHAAGAGGRGAPGHRGRVPAQGPQLH